MHSQWGSYLAAVLPQHLAKKVRTGLRAGPAENADALQMNRVARNVA